jgi:hypothetical protein
MNDKKARLLMIGLIAVLSIFLSAPHVLAGEPAPDLSQYKIIGPTMWAVGVVDCSNVPFSTLRVKKIEDCDVDTATLSLAGAFQGITGCPGSAQQVLYYTLAPGSLFGLSTECEPIITKIKNWKDEGTAVSFDAQINFLVDINYAGTECTPPPPTP